MQTCNSGFAEKKRKRFVLHPNADQINENIAMAQIFWGKNPQDHRACKNVAQNIHWTRILFLEDQQMK